MRTLITCFLFLVLLLLGSGCENLLIKDLELDEFDFEKVMVIQGEITNFTDSVAVVVSENIAITSTNDDIVFVDNAALSLNYEQTLLSEFGLRQNEKYIGVIEAPNDPGKYFLSVNSPQLGEVSAVTEIPEPVDINDIEFTENAGIDPLEQVNTSSLRFTIKDPPGVKNYYSFKVDITNGAEFIDTLITETGDTIFNPVELVVSNNVTDPNIENMRNGEIFLNDSTFDGKDYIIVLRFRVRFGGRVWAVEDIDQILDRLHLQWKVISEDYYRFYTSLQDYENTQFGLFADPVGVYTNVENGLGAFIGSNVQYISFQ